MNEFTKERQIIPILCAAFLDYLNITICLVVFPVLMVHETRSILPMSMSAGFKTLLLGFLLTSYYVGQFVAAPIWGKLSDNYGRKPMFLITMSGTIIGCFCTAIAIDFGYSTLLFVGRIIAGLFAANLALAQSSMADLSTTKNKVGNLTMVEMAVGLSFVVGGLLGGRFTDSSIISWFGMSTPFWLLGAVSVVNLVFLAFRFEETLKEHKNVSVSFFEGFTHVGRAFTNSVLGTVSYVWAIFVLGWNFYSQFFSTFLFQKFEFTSVDIGNTFVYAGFLYILVQFLLVKPLSKIMSPARVLCFSLLLVGVPSIGMLYTISTVSLYVLISLYVIAIALSLPNLMGVISNLAGPQIQGEVIGMMWSVQAMVTVMSTFLGSFLVALNPTLPLKGAGAFIALSWVLYMAYYYSKNQQSSRR